MPAFIAIMPVCTNSLQVGVLVAFVCKDSAFMPCLKIFMEWKSCMMHHQNDVGGIFAYLSGIGIVLFARHMKNV